MNGHVPNGDNDAEVQAARIQAQQNIQKAGNTFEETIEHYNQTAATYRKDVDSVGYQGPSLAVSNLVKLGLPTDIKILDVACGTGWVASLLPDEYNTMDGLDASHEMLTEARKLNIYGKLYCAKIGDGNKALQIPDNTYDALTFVGGLVAGHIKLDAFEELIRVCKPGGYIITSFREEFRRTVKEYLHIDKYLEELEERGLWQKVSESITPRYFMDFDGLTMVHRITKSD